MMITRFLRIALAILVVLGGTFAFTTNYKCDDVWTGSPKFTNRFDGQHRFSILVHAPTSIQLVGNYGFFDNKTTRPDGNSKIYYQFWKQRNWVNDYTPSRFQEGNYAGPNTFTLTHSYLPGQLPPSGTWIAVYMSIYYGCTMNNGEVVCNQCNYFSYVQAP